MFLLIFKLLKRLRLFKPPNAWLPTLPTLGYDSPQRLQQVDRNYARPVTLL